MAKIDTPFLAKTAKKNIPFGAAYLYSPQYIREHPSGEAAFLN